MPEMTCHPGQDGTVAVADCPVVLRPVSGTFPISPETLYLKSSQDGEGPLPLLLPAPLSWSPNAILARIPSSSCGTGDKGETFSIWFTSGGATWETDAEKPVLIVGPRGNYPDPPTHKAMSEPGQGGTPATAGSPVELQPVTGDFGARGEVRLYSSSTGVSASMTIDDWNANQIHARMPEDSPGNGEAGETFTIIISTEGGRVFLASPVLVTGEGYPAMRLPSEELQPQG